MEFERQNNDADDIGDLIIEIPPAHVATYLLGLLTPFAAAVVAAGWLIDKARGR